MEYSWNPVRTPKMLSKMSRDIFIRRTIRWSLVTQTKVRFNRPEQDMDVFSGSLAVCQAQRLERHASTLIGLVELT